MKCATVQVACPASTGNMDFTDGTAGFSTDVNFALFTTSVATANDTATARGRFGIGFTDGANNFACAMDESDATAGAGAQGIVSTSKCILAYTANSGVAAPVGGFSSLLSNGVRMNITTATTGRLVSATMLGGPDNAAKVGSIQFISSDTSKVITHGLGGTPETIGILIGAGGNGDLTAISGMGFGLYDSSGTMVGGTIALNNNANPTQDNALINSGETGRVLNVAGSSAATLTVTSVGATQFTITMSAAPGSNVLVGWFALRGTSTPMVSKTFLNSSPTSPGNQVAVSSMSAKPQVIWRWCTRMTAAGSVVTDDTAGAFGLGMACNNNGTTQYGSAFAACQDAVATSAAKNVASNTCAGGTLDNTGAFVTKNTINSWDSGGVTDNFSAVSASALQFAGIALGIPAGFPTGTLGGGFEQLSGNVG